MHGENLKLCKYLFLISASSTTYTKTTEKYQFCLQNFLSSNRICVFQVRSHDIVLSDTSKYTLNMQVYPIGLASTFQEQYTILHI
jgi:hypothetical protein